MRIAVFHDLPSGGAKRTLFESLKQLSLRHDLEIYSLTTSDRDFCDLEPLARRQRLIDFSPPRLFGSPFGRLNQFQRWSGLRRLDNLAAIVAREIDGAGYDVVFAHPCMWSQAPLPLLYLKTPVVYYCQEPPRHIYEPDYQEARNGRAFRHMLDAIDPLIFLHRSTARRLDWEATRAARRVLVNSEFMRRRVAAIYGIDPVVCYHGIDTNFFRPLSGVQRQGYVLSVGAIKPHKGHDFLIESLSRLPDASRPSLRLVGNAEVAAERRHLENLAARHGVQMEIEVGIDDEDLVRRYNEASLIVYAPHNEPFGLVPLEAMACGTPVVAVSEGGVCESVVSGVTGVLVERDRSRFAEAVTSLLAHPTLRADYGRQGVEFMHGRWTWESAVDALELHLSAAAAEERGKR